MDFINKMDPLDKLYFKYISSNRQIEHHPIIDLFLIRNEKNFLPKISDDSLEFRYFSNLPVIPFSQLSDLYNKLLTTPFQSAFQNYSKILKYDPNFIKELVKLKMKVHINLIAEKSTENDNVPDYLGQHYVVSLFFCLLMYVLNTNDDTVTFTLLKIYSEELESFGSLTPPFSTIKSFLYSKLIEKFAVTQSFKFDNESIDLICHHISTNLTLDFYFSSVYLKLVQKVSDQYILNRKAEKAQFGLNIHGVNKFLDTLSIVIQDKKKCLNVSDYQKLAMILVTFISDLNLHAVKVLVNLSLNSNSPEIDVKKSNNPPSIKDSFILLPQLLLKKLQNDEVRPFINSRDFPHIPDKILEISLEENDEFMNYVSNKPYMLEDGFTPIYVNPPIPLKQLLNENFSHFLLNFSNELKRASGLCIDNFFMAMFKLLDALEESNEFYYDLLITALFIATACVEAISLMSLYEMFHRKTIFYPSFTIFDDVNSTKIMSIRFHILNLFACQMDQLIPQFLNSAVQFPFLFCEEIAFISTVNQINLQVFMTKEFVVSIFTVIKGLIKEYFEQENKEKTFIALQTVLSFLFTLLSNDTIIEQFFISRYFISNFFQLVFVDFLKLFVLATTRDFLLNIKEHNSTFLFLISNITTYFTHLFIKLNQIEFENKTQSIIDIMNCLLTSLSMNMNLSTYFSNVLDSFLSLTPNFPEILPLSLKFMSIINLKYRNKLNSKQLRILLQMIRKIDGMNPSQATKVSLLNLCSASVTLHMNSLFLIQRPSMIPLMLIAYGESDMLIEILKVFDNLCNYSLENCYAIHESSLKPILLKFIYNFLIKQSRSIKFRGLQFTLKLTEDDIYDFIFPFLYKLMKVSTNNSELYYLNKLITQFDNQKLSLKVGFFILDLLVDVKTQVSPIFPIGFNHSPLSITKLNPNVFNKSFTFLTWIKVDHPIAIKLNQAIPIITITDESSKKNQKKKTATNMFCLFINRGLLYYQFNDYVEQICAKIPSNEWFFIGFVCQRSTQQLSCIALFSELSMGYCQDVPAVYFPPDSSLKLKIGGSCSNDKLPILMGPFAILNKMVDEDFLDSAEKQGPSVINLLPKDLVVIRTESSTYKKVIDLYVNQDINQEMKIKFEKIKLFEELKLRKFEHMFCSNEVYLIKFMEVFIKLDQAPSELCNLVLAILKQSFDISLELQNSFVGVFGLIRKYFMKFARVKATFELYRIFYSILEIVKSNETVYSIFDNFLVNVELYSNGPPSSFERIVRHWSTTLLNRHPMLFKRNNYFNRLIKMYVYLFTKKAFDDRYTVEITDRIKNHFCTLLVGASKLGLTSENISYFENFINIQTDNLLVFLKILERNITKVEVGSDYQLTLHHFAESENLEVAKIAMISIHQLTKPNWMKPMMALAIQLKTKIVSQTARTAVIGFLLDKITEYPGFIQLITSLIVSFDDNEKEMISNELCDICNVTTTNQNSNSEIIKEILKEKFWFIWLLRTALHSAGTVQLNFLTLISFFLFYSDDLQSELNLIITVLQIFEAVDKTFDYYQVLLDLFVNVNAVCMMNSRFLIIPFLRSLFFKFTEVSYSNEIIHLFETGPFNSDYQHFVNQLNINLSKSQNPSEFGILSLENLLNQDFGNYKLLFSYSVQIGHTLTEGQLANFLIQLIESNNIDLNISTANQIINTILQNNNSVNLELTSAQNQSDIASQIVEFSGDVLIDFVQSILHKTKIEYEDQLDNLNRINKSLSKIQNQYNDFFLKSLCDCLVEIRDIIKDIKKLVFIDFESVKRNSIETLKNSDHVSEFAKKVAKIEIRKFAAIFNKYKKTSERIMCRESNLLLSYCPCKLQRIPEMISMNDFLKRKPSTISSKMSASSFQIKLFEFGKEISALIVIQQDVIKLFECSISDNHNLIEKLPFNKIDLIIIREKLSIEMFTSKSGSFYFELLKENDFGSVLTIFSDHFSSSNQLFILSKNNKPNALQSPSNLKTLKNVFQTFEYMKYCTTGLVMTHFEYLMFLNYFSGFSFHKNGKKPRLPISNSPVSALLFFLPEFASPELSTTPQQVYENRLNLELADIQQLAKKKYPLYIPKPNSIVFNPNPIHQTLYRDLKLEHDQILTGGFVKSTSNDNSVVFIITKNGEVHFVEILKDKLKHIKTYHSDFLNSISNDELSIVKSHDGFLAISQKMLQRFTPTYESSIADTRIEPPLISIDGKEMVYVSNDCDIRKCSTTDNVSLASNHSTPIVNSNLGMAHLTSTATSPLLMNSIQDQNGNPQNYVTQNENHESKVSIELMYSSESAITCISISSKFDVIVYGTEKCQIVVNSLNSSKTRHSIISTKIEQNVNDDSLIYIGNEPQKVLITSGFGFIVTEAQKTLFAHTINGTFIGYIEIDNSIIDWCTFMNSKCQDFVIFIDQDNRIGVFEVSSIGMNSNHHIKYLQSRPGTNTITYITEMQCIVAFSKHEGVLTLYPISLENFLCD